MEKDTKKPKEIKPRQLSKMEHRAERQRVGKVKITDLNLADVKVPADVGSEEETKTVKAFELRCMEASCGVITGQFQLPTDMPADTDLSKITLADVGIANIRCDDHPLAPELHVVDIPVLEASEEDILKQEAKDAT